MLNVPRVTALVAAVLTAFLPMIVSGVTCVGGIQPSNPDEVYVVHGDGTATDRRTGLMWKQCREGQTFVAGATGYTCTGTATTATWDAARTLAAASTFASYSDWRLPNVKELQSLAEQCKFNPAINDVIFPGANGSVVWSSSPFGYNSSFAWYVNFGFGDAGNALRSVAYPVRLVRGGQ
jgi:Protein of unknown function (DUF1566)